MLPFAFLCIKKNVRTWGDLNIDDGSLEYISQFRKTEGWDRANLRWVDVNGELRTTSQDYRLETCHANINGRRLTG